MHVYWIQTLISPSTYYLQWEEMPYGLKIIDAKNPIPLQDLNKALISLLLLMISVYPFPTD